jgi:hypothetical protein
LPVATHNGRKGMSSKSRKAGWVGAALVLTLCFTASLSAIPNPISKAGSVSKTVAQKVFDGTKAVVRESGVVIKDAGTTAWHASDSLASHIRSAF